MDREEVLKVAKECGFLMHDSNDRFILLEHELERFAAAMYAKGAKDTRERAVSACAKVRADGDTYTVNEDNHEDGHTDGCNNCAWAISALPITPDK